MRVRYDLGIYLALTLSSAEVSSLTDEELRDLRDDFGATEDLIVAMRELARLPGRWLRLHFDSQSVALLPARPAAEDTARWHLGEKWED